MVKYALITFFGLILLCVTVNAQPLDTQVAYPYAGAQSAENAPTPEDNVPWGPAFEVPSADTCVTYSKPCLRELCLNYNAVPDYVKQGQDAGMVYHYFNEKYVECYQAEAALSP